MLVQPEEKWLNKSDYEFDLRKNINDDTSAIQVDSTKTLLYLLHFTVKITNVNGRNSRRVFKWFPCAKNVNIPIT
jgi:hypothetical protein